MNDVNCYERLVTAALASLLGVCAFLATAKFVRSCVQVLSLLLRAQGSVFALLLGSMAAVAVIEGTAKLTNDPPSQVQQHGAGLTANAPQGQDGGAPSRRRGDAPPYRTVGSRVPRDRNAGNWPGQITDEDITNGWRAVGGEGSVAPVEMPSGAVTNDLLRRRGGGDWAFRVAPEGVRVVEYGTTQSGGILRIGQLVTRLSKSLVVQTNFKCALNWMKWEL